MLRVPIQGHSVSSSLFSSPLPLVVRNTHSVWKVYKITKIKKKLTSKNNNIIVYFIHYIFFSTIFVNAFIYKEKYHYELKSYFYSWIFNWTLHHVHFLKGINILQKEEAFSTCSSWSNIMLICVYFFSKSVSTHGIKLLWWFFHCFYDF